MSDGMQDEIVECATCGWRGARSERSFHEKNNNAHQRIKTLEAELQKKAQELGEAGYMNQFTAAFADKLKEFGTVDRLIEEYSASKMKARELTAALTLAREALVAIRDATADTSVSDKNIAINTLNKIDVGGK